MHVTERARFRPSEAHGLEQTGLAPALVVELVLRHVFFEGTTTLTKLVQRLKLSPHIIEAAYRHIYREQLCETRPMIGNDYEICLNTKGRSMAEVALKKSQYAGAAPVTLADYTRAVEAQALRLDVTAESLAEALNDLVVPDAVIRELGAALVTGGTLLLYGGTGNGKTSLAERLPRLFEDSVYVPYAVEVSGQIVTVFDPLIHMVERDDSPDPRWLLCRRPMVKVGGEMRAEMLDTNVDEITRVCTAPLQMKANNGILLIDDFGRQRVTPRELLNRWIVPLDRGKDILSLWSGATFEIPFEVLVVFATNLPLSDLAEDAFMRRLKNKIKIDSLSEGLFKDLLKRVCEQRHLVYSPEVAEYMVRECLKRSETGLRACFPTDLVNIISGIAAFERRVPQLDEPRVDHAVRVYFAR
jgi:predicted ATPase with chaperone activity